MQPMLNEGDIILIHGFVMLKGLEDGDKYRISKVSTRGGHLVYWFSKPRGKKILIGHYVNEVDIMINPLNNNRIEVIKRS